MPASDWFNKAEPFGYLRISDAEQSADDERQPVAIKKTTIKRQMKYIQDTLKAQGLPPVKKGNWFAEVKTGRDANRKQWKALREKAMNHSGRAFIVVSRTDRWGRNTDDAVEAWKPLKDRGIPIYAIQEGWQTGSKGDRRPQEALMFLLNAAFAANLSDLQADKGDIAVERQREEQVMPAKGTSLFPFASIDPIDVIEANQYLLAREGNDGSISNFTKTTSALTQPNGPSKGSMKTMLEQYNARTVNLSEQEHENWKGFRKMIRDILIEADYDPWPPSSWKGKIGRRNWAMHSLMRMVGLYLKEPWEYPMPTNELIEEVIKDYPKYLSDKDKKRRGKKGL